MTTTADTAEESREQSKGMVGDKLTAGSNTDRHKVGQGPLQANHKTASEHPTRLGAWNVPRQKWIST